MEKLLILAMVVALCGGLFYFLALVAAVAGAFQ